jgi:integrase/recombinase XerC
MHLPEDLRKRLADYLRRRLEVDTTDPALLLSSRRRRLSARQVQQMVEKRGREAGIVKRVTPHMLRRTFATKLYERTRDLLVVQRALDHRFVGTTQRYAEVGGEMGIDRYTKIACPRKARRTKTK